MHIITLQQTMAWVIRFSKASNMGRSIFSSNRVRKILIFVISSILIKASHSFNSRRVRSSNVAPAKRSVDTAADLSAKSPEEIRKSYRALLSFIENIQIELQNQEDSNLELQHRIHDLLTYGHGDHSADHAEGHHISSSDATLQVPLSFMEHIEVELHQQDALNLELQGQIHDLLDTHGYTHHSADHPEEHHVSSRDAIDTAPSSNIRHKKLVPLPDAEREEREDFYGVSISGPPDHHDTEGGHEGSGEDKPLNAWHPSCVLPEEMCKEAYYRNVFGLSTDIRERAKHPRWEYVSVIAEITCNERYINELTHCHASEEELEHDDFYCTKSQLELMAPDPEATNVILNHCQKYDFPIRDE